MLTVERIEPPKPEPAFNLTGLTRAQMLALRAVCGRAGTATRNLDEFLARHGLNREDVSDALASIWGGRSRSRGVPGEPV